MRVNIIIIALIFLTSHNTWAASCDDLSLESCRATAGCGTDESGVCKNCSNSQYSDATMEKCTNCTNKPTENGTFNWGTKTNNESNSCSWTGKCNANFYWDGRQCKSCDQNYHSSQQQQLTFNGGTSSLPSANNTCTGNIYTITLEKNLTNIWEKAKTVFVKYGSGFADSKDATSWRPNPNLTPSIKWWQTFNGYSAGEKDRYLWINAKGELTNGKTNTSFTDDTKLYGQWNGVDFTVIYYASDGITENQRQSCTTAPDSETATSGCKVLDYNGNIDGQYLDYWKCTSGCEEKNVKLSPNDTFPINSSAKPDSIKLVAVMAPCPNGYYCAAGSKNPCPMGSTSNSGAKEISECYINNNTQFCDDSGNSCFNLPTGIKLYYKQ